MNMFEKVNPSHPDKVADRIAGAMVDLAYSRQKDPRVAIEVMVGHGEIDCIAESSYRFTEEEVAAIASRITGRGHEIRLICVPQDPLLSKNQSGGFRCGDNGIFKGCPTTAEQAKLTKIAKRVYRLFPSDGKYLISEDGITICQSRAGDRVLRALCPGAVVNPLGPWEGGEGTDTGCANRKLGSDLGDAVTGGGLHGKDLSKADVSVTIHAFIEAQRIGKPVAYHCSIGDEEVGGIPFRDIVEEARAFVMEIGGFEKLAEWGLIR